MDNVIKTPDQVYQEERARRAQDANTSKEDEHMKAFDSVCQMFASLPMKFTLAEIAMMVLTIDPSVKQKNPEKYYALIGDIRKSLKSAQKFVEEVTAELEKIEPSNKNRVV